jgi:hypothetical protein
MTHDKDTVRTEREGSSCDERAGEAQLIVDLLDYRDVSGSGMQPFPKPPPVPDFAAHSPPDKSWNARGAPPPGGSVAPVAFGSIPPPDPPDLARIRREVRRRTALAVCAMALPVATMLAIGAAGNDDKGRAAGAAQAQVGVTRHALSLTEAVARHERETLAVTARESEATDAFAAVARVTVPETVIVGVLRAEGPSAPAPDQLSPPAEGAADALPPAGAVPTSAALGTLESMRLARSTHRISPGDSPLAVDAQAAPGASELEVTYNARPAVPGTESQIPPTRLEPDNVAARGRLDTGR